ncbi:MAG: MBL fold metallo-hydrolase [Deltaproteobacteria bacterium HGW-Deltaproteobacteria-10]|nr:MAG: MBL fold metallo-hydrolase [Deltaproteobacteria bacterium HGW-Deltaproteobacteria-10]
MIEQIYPDIFRMEIPLPGNPLKAVNSYVIKGDQRFLIIDTGMNMNACREAMAAGLAELAVDLDKTDFFITHLHADHLGLVSELVRPAAKVYFNYPDAQIMNDFQHWDDVKATALNNGFSVEEVESALQKHPGRKYFKPAVLDYTLLREGDHVSIGRYDFRCVETPGHTPGHLCLYEAQEKIFFSGDHILEDITPNISMWADIGNPLSDYLNSLDKINGFDIRHVFPGHRRIFTDHRKRIAELKKHHQKRAEEVLVILKGAGQNAYQVASQMTWDIDCKTWDDFPAPQKWFASGEALSHLQYLLLDNKLTREMVKGKAYYSTV